MNDKPTAQTDPENRHDMPRIPFCSHCKRVMVLRSVRVGWVKTSDIPQFVCLKCGATAP